MEWVVLIFLASSLFLYCLLGGADFGVGVHEWCVDSKEKRQHEEIVKEAMGPVWEANHMWLIIAIVILFVGFPKVYSEVSIHLHIPVTFMLIGVITRGCAFSFRHYDSIEDGSRKYYSWFFSLSSLLTPVAFGILIGALMLGRIQPQPTDYFSTYVKPWMNFFCLATGLFVLSIFTFISGVFMIGEQNIGPFKKGYVKRVKFFHLLMILTGALVFAAAQWDGFPLARIFLEHPLALTAVACATVPHFFLWRLFEIDRAWKLRWITGFQIFMILAAWLAVIFPNAIFYADGTTLSFLNPTAHAKTTFTLGMSLILGAVLFLPLYGYLFFIFKRPLPPTSSSNVSSAENL